MLSSDHDRVELSEKLLDRYPQGQQAAEGALIRSLSWSDEQRCQFHSSSYASICLYPEPYTVRGPGLVPSTLALLQCVCQTVKWAATLRCGLTPTCASAKLDSMSPGPRDVCSPWTACVSAMVMMVTLAVLFPICHCRDVTRLQPARGSLR